jgi:DNA end-binding protein Ku
MAGRTIWKGELKVGSTTLPIKLYAAIQDRNVHFHVLRGKTKSRVKQQMATDDKEPLPKQQIRKGYEIEPGRFVIVEEQELQQLKPKESRIISFSRFVPVGELGNEWYERPYYLGPDGAGSEAERYFALAEAIGKKNLAGVAHWTMRGKSYVGALRVEKGYLMLIKLRYSEEILPADELPAPGGRPLEAKELQMAEELIGALEGKFEPEQFRDEYRGRVMKFVEAKAKGKHPRLPAVEDRPVGGSLDAQLTKSLAAMKRGREKKVA